MPNHHGGIVVHSSFLGMRAGHSALLEFLTVLPQECEDAAQAAHASSAEHAFHLKSRVRGWCVDVAAWLHSMHSTAMNLFDAALQGPHRHQQLQLVEQAVLQASQGL